MTEVHGSLRDKLKLSGIADKMNKEYFFFDISEAVQNYKNRDQEMLHSG